MTRKIAPKLKKAKTKRPRHLSTHHLTPRSRNGSNHEKNLVEWDSVFHDAYHRLFANLMLEEAIELLRIVSEGGTEWTIKDIQELRERLIHETERHEQRTMGERSDISDDLQTM